MLAPPSSRRELMVSYSFSIGGDGLPNCHSGSKCHIPMTATVTNPATGLSVVVSIVDGYAFLDKSAFSP